MAHFMTDDNNFANAWMGTMVNGEMRWYCGTCGLRLTLDHDDTAVVRSNSRTIVSIECGDCYEKRMKNG